MYLRTPKRYRQGQKRSLISFRWLWLWILTPLIVFVGVQLYNNRESVSPQVERLVTSLIDTAQSGVATAMAPTPLPTQDPAQRIASAQDAWARGAIDEAVEIYSGLLNAVPNDVSTYYRYTLGLAMSGKLAQALDAAERTVTANPYSADAWAIRAMVLNWIGRPSEAIASALQALALAGNDQPQSQARAQAFLAEAYFDVGQYDRALSTVERALTINPDSFEAHRVRSQIMQDYQFDFVTALEDSQTAYDLAPNLPYLAIDLAVLNLREGETDTALGILRDVVDLNPQNTRALWWIGTIYLNTVGDPNQASDYLSRCVQVAPDNINCHYTLGRAQIRLEQYTLASESFETTIRLGTTEPRHYWWAARAQVLTVGCPAAVSYLQTGYLMAKEGSDSQLISDFEDAMRACQMVVDSPVEPAEETTPEAES
jgi:tetratricopeptide (TPR) repeat protein